MHNKPINAAKLAAHSTLADQHHPDEFQSMANTSKCTRQALAVWHLFIAHFIRLRLHHTVIVIRTMYKFPRTDSSVTFL